MSEFAVVSMPASSMRMVSAVRSESQGTAQLLSACGVRNVSKIVGRPKLKGVKFSLSLLMVRAQVLDDSLAYPEGIECRIVPSQSS